MRDALALAFGTLTAWPVPPPRRIDSRAAGRAMLLAPLTQLPLLALTAVGASVWAWLGGPIALLSLLLVAALVVSTRGMHMDGLADTADGLSASYDPERTRQVMKSGDVGPSGVAAIALVLGVQTIALTALLTPDGSTLSGVSRGSSLAPAGAALAIVAVLVSRQVLTCACVRGIPAAPGSGLGAGVASTVSRPHLTLSCVVMLALSVLPGLLGASWWAGPLSVLAAWAATAALVLRAQGRVGGITGDILGAAIEVSLAAALAMGALAL